MAMIDCLPIEQRLAMVKSRLEKQIDIATGTGSYAAMVEALRLIDDLQRKHQEQVRSEFFILWNPDSDQPPRVKQETYREALGVAELMAKRNPGERFYVMKPIADVKTGGIQFNEY